MVRIKYRYLVANILFPTTSAAQATIPTTLQFHSPTPSHVNIPLLLSQLRSNISALFGDYGLGVTSSSLKMIYFSPATSTLIIRCPRAHFRLVWAAMTCMESLPGARRGDEGVSCVMRVVRVSGTIKKAEEDVVRCARREIVRAKMAMEGREGDLLETILGPATKTDQLKGKISGIEGIEVFDEDEDMHDDSD
jgi:ribonuclease P/MRP protein subunit POP5